MRENYINTESSDNNVIAQRLSDISHQAEARYGSDALFAYPSGDQLKTMTLQEAMIICGPAIASEDESGLWSKLDKWNRAANILGEKYPDRLQTSLGRGAATLEAIQSERQAGGTAEQ